MNINIKIGGAAGAGVKSVGAILAKLLIRGGFNVFEYPEYPSLIRGGHNTEQIFASRNGAFSQIKPVDILLALDRKTVEIDLADVRRGGAVIYDGSVSPISRKDHRFLWIDIPMLEIAKKSGSPLMANNVGVGALVKLLGLPIGAAKTAIGNEFSDKSAKIISGNQKALANGYRLIDQPLFSLPAVKKAKKKFILTGNDAVSLGAVAAGLGLYVSYPMTPSTSVLHFLSAHQAEYGYVVRQPEDEIAAVNMAIGAMHAGVRSMTGTSGGGFALMNESLSLSGMTEIPLVIYLASRPGPATGLPTWTEQADLRQVISAGHGEFPRLVLAPGNADEAFSLTAEAFNLAECYQLPVIILSDKYLAESAMAVGKFKDDIKIERGGVVGRKELSRRRNFLRYRLTKTGISPRSLPGSEGGVFTANSDEHGYHGLVDESEKMRISQNKKRLMKGQYLAKNLPPPKLIGPRTANTTLITWGSTLMPAMQALEQSKESGGGKGFNILHFSYVWPINAPAVKKALGQIRGRAILLEGNAGGQFESVLKETTGYQPEENLKKYSGRPFYPEEILPAVAK